MKQLLLMRHAHSPEGEPDQDRMIDALGQQQVESIAKQIVAYPWAPEMVLCSTAKRCQQTWNVFGSHLSKPPLVLSSDRLYRVSLQSFLDEIHMLPEHLSLAMVVGHNPNCSDVLEYWCSERMSVLPSEAYLLQTQAPSWQAALSHHGLFVIKKIFKPDGLAIS